MPRRNLCFVGLILAACVLSSGTWPEGRAAGETDQVLFDFADKAAAKDWSPVKIPDVEKDQPAPRIEIAPSPKGKDAGPLGQCLKITYDGGVWPTIGTTKIPIPGNWRTFQTLKADVFADRPCVAHFRIYQGKSDDTLKQPRWERTLTLESGRNDVTLLLRPGIGAMDPANGDVTSFVIGMFRPEKGQTLLVGNVRLSTDWPAPKLTGWYSPYNHDGYSSAVAREFARTGVIPKFKVLGTEMEVADLSDLAKRLKDKWVKPEPKTMDQVESEFKTEFTKIQKAHPRAVMTILREGEKGWDRANPEKPYEGWKYVYVNCHGPSGPNPGREKTPGQSETVEVFMRHRSVLLRADFASIPKGADILAARLVITRLGAKDLKVPEQPNMWAAEPCNRAWDESSANCYFYAPGKHWKGVSGLYYGEDPDFWPVFLTHGPAGGGAVSSWDFAQAIKFWQDGKHPNHGFFLHGDSKDYMLMYTHRARNVQQRPALMVIYEPKSELDR